MTEQQANSVYTILVDLGGAQERDRNDFVYHHTVGTTNEWRFQGKFGFGGKYRASRNSVDFYREDETAELLKLQNEINVELSKLSI